MDDAPGPTKVVQRSAIARIRRRRASTPLERQLGRVARTLEMQQRVRIANALAEVILSDARVTLKETRFFNMVAGALDLTPAALAGLFPHD